MMNRTLPGNPPSALSNRPPLTALETLIPFVLVSLLFATDTAEAGRKQVHRPQPDLKILSVGTSPSSYSPQTGPLDFAIEIELPKDLDGATILEVSALVSSPSKRSMRFLSNRQPIGTQALPHPTPANESQTQTKPHLAVTLTWDGRDQSEQLAERGTYAYEIRAKLLAVGEKGPRTQMVSWPKRGTVEVK